MRAKGEGSIFKRTINGKTYWYATYGLKNTTQKKTFSGKTQQEVQKKLRDFIKDYENGIYIEKSDVTLIELIAELSRAKFELNQISAATYKRNKEAEKIVSKMKIADMKICEIENEDIQESLKNLISYSKSVIEKVKVCISGAFDIAVVRKIIPANPFKVKGSIIVPKSLKKTAKVEALTFEEQSLFLKQLKDYEEPFRTILYVLIYTGMRVGEVLALTRDDIKENYISVNKTLTKNEFDKVVLGDKTKTYAGLRDVPILGVLKPILHNYLLQNKNYFIFESRGSFITPSTINSRFKRIAKDAGVKVIDIKVSNLNKLGLRKNLKSSSVHTHMLRHTFATRCIESGMSPVVLSKILGHKSIEITLNTYTDVFNKYQNEELKKAEKFLSQFSEV